jgi:hypothetical protein
VTFLMPFASKSMPGGGSSQIKAWSGMPEELIMKQDFHELSGTELAAVAGTGPNANQTGVPAINYPPTSPRGGSTEYWPV